MRQNSSARYSRTSVHLATLALAAGLALAGNAALAQQTAGSINGHATAGAQITVVNKAIGIARVVSADAQGSYQVSALPAGDYEVSFKRADGVSSTKTVRVAAGEGTVADFVQQLDQVVVTGTSVKTIDVKSTESVQVLGKAEIDRVPVVRDVTAIALLAPGATVGDSRIGSTAARAGNVPSLGGASPAENAYYINGFNVTNMVNGVAFNQVPFEGIAEQSVKTGGYGAEFGRSLGGVISVTTRRGTNEWHGGVNLKFADTDFGGGRSVHAGRDSASSNWLLAKDDAGTRDMSANLWASGPLIKDRLFAFALVQATDVTSDPFGEQTQADQKNTSPQYLLKLDWNVSDNNLFELTAFSDKNKVKTTNWNSLSPYSPVRTTQRGQSWETAGGQNLIAKWTSWLTEDFTLSAMVGQGKYDRSSYSSTAECPYVQDRRTTPRVSLGCWVSSTIGDPDAGDKRDAYRLDAEWVRGRHTLKAGLDFEKYSVVDGSQYTGDGVMLILHGTAGQKLGNGYVLPSDMDYVSWRWFKNGGSFTTENAAWYLEDGIQLSRNVLASFGIRNESFTNKNADGKPFIKIKNTWAPRIGASWDVHGDASLKVFANAGRYFIPVYSNTNVRLSGSELDYTDYYAYTGANTDDRFQRPVLGAQLGERALVSTGQTPDPRSVVDPKIKPMYQDEFIIGMQKALAKGWTVGAKYTHRQLGSSMDDICNDEGPTQWALENGYSEAEAAAIGAAIGHCFLYNPGNDLNANIDLDGSGMLTQIRIPAAALQMPKAKRTWDALELTFERVWDKKWSFQGSYVLAFSRGNTEGAVKSDIGQDDAGISQDFDYPGLMEGSEGYLPNDRRHTFKFWGSYAVNDEWRVGANMVIQSGRPKNCFGVYAGTLDGVSALYGDSSFWCRNKDGVYVLNPRGTLGRLPWSQTLNLQATYTPQWLKGLTLSVDLLNALNQRAIRSISEREDSGMFNTDSSYGRPLGWTPARSLRLLAQYEF